MGLDRSIAHHLRSELKLQSGRTVTLAALDQEMSYAGLLEGIPDAKSNDWYIETSLRAARRRCADGAMPHLIDPPRRGYLREPGDMLREIENRPHRTPEWLPMVRCIGSFRDVVTARDRDRDLSVLVVVWFQDEYAMPIGEPALSQLRALDWDSLATDVDV